MSHLVLAAFRVLVGSVGPGHWHDLRTVAAVLRESDDAEVEALVGAPMDDRQAWYRLQAVAAEFGAGLIALDLKTEYCNPDAHAHLRAGWEGELDEAA